MIRHHILNKIGLVCTFVLAASLGYSQSAGIIKGTVLDAETGKPLEGANLILLKTEYKTTSNADGSYLIEDVKPDTYAIKVNFGGYATTQQLITVKAGKTTEVIFNIATKVATLKKLVVTGRAANLLALATSASQGRVGQAQLKTRPLLRTGEVLETVPGLIATQHSGSGKANQFFMRGLNLDHGTDFSVALEGMPINLRTHAHGQGYLDINFLIPELIKTIKYRRGPYYADVGDFSSVGNAQIQLMDKLDDAIVKTEVGSREFYRGLFANSSKIGKGNLLYGLTARYYNGPWNLPENAIKLSGVIKYSGGNNKDGYAITALGYYNNWNATDQIPKRAVNQNHLSRFGIVDSTDGGVTGRYSLVGNWWQTSANGSRTEATIYAAYYHVNLFSNFTYYLNFPQEGDQFEQAGKRLYAGGNITQKWNVDWFAKKNIITLGADIRHDQIFEVGLYNTNNRERFNTVRNDQVIESSAGIFLESNIQWTNWLQTIVGGRANFFLFDVESKIKANAGTTTDFIASPKVGIILGPWFKTEFYINGGLGFHSNDARGTTIQVDPVSNQPVMRVDPLVRTRAAEVGIRTAIIPRLQTTVSVWYLGLNSELVFVGDAGGTEASRASEHFGVEWNNYYQITKWLRLLLDVAFTESHYTEDAPEGNEIPNSINRIISGGISAGYSLGWNASIRVRHFGPRPLTSSGSPMSQPTTLLNVNAGYNFKNVEVSLNVFNLLNSRASDISYYYPSQLKNEANPVTGIVFHPVIPRTARLAVTLYF